VDAGAWFNYPFLTQKERDIETGLDYFGARYFASTQGRFTSADEPFADQSEDDPQSWNLYSYVGNNPLSFTDPFGLWKWVDPGNNGNRFLQWEKGDDWHTLSTFLYNETGRDYLAGDLEKAYSSGGLGADTIVDVTGAPSRFFTANRGGVQDTSWSFYLTVLPAAQAVRSVGGLLRGAAGLFAREAVVATETAASREAIDITSRGLAHVLARHSAGGAKTAAKSIFNASEDLVGLIRQAESVPAVQQAGRQTFQRVVDAGRIIGRDRATGQPTSIYTVITDAAGRLKTAFPGKP
jgi:RHS repeat-associated protein